MADELKSGSPPRLTIFTRGLQIIRAGRLEGHKCNPNARHECMRHALCRHAPSRSALVPVPARRGVLRDGLA